MTGLGRGHGREGRREGVERARGGDGGDGEGEAVHQRVGHLRPHGGGVAAAHGLRRGGGSGRGRGGGGVVDEGGVAVVGDVADAVELARRLREEEEEGVRDVSTERMRVSCRDGVSCRVGRVGRRTFPSTMSQFVT
jgi:hypothetical protein